MRFKGPPPEKSNFGIAWLLLGLTFAAHTADEGVHSFLKYFNATVGSLAGSFWWFPRIQMNFKQWLYGLLAVNILLLALTPWAFRNARWLRPVAYLYAWVFFLNGIWHLAIQLHGGLLRSVQLEGPAPGVYTAPLLLIASGYLFWRLKKTAAN